MCTPFEAGNADGDARPSAGLLAPARHLVARVVGQPDQEVGERERALADPVDADLLDHVVPGGGGVQGGHVRRPGQEARDPLRVLELGLERERPSMPLPADERGLELLDQVGADIQPPRPGAAAEPLDRASGRERDAEPADVQRHRSSRLVGVEEDVGTGLLGPPLHRCHVLQLRRLEEHMAQRHEERSLVDRVDQRIQVGDDLDLCVRLRLEQVAHRRELAFDVDDPVARRSQPEAGQDDGDGNRHVLVHADGAGRGADDPADLVADRERHLPPAFAPRADPARPPHPRVLGEPLLGGSRHRRQRVVDQVGRLREDRKAVPVGGDVHGRRV